MNKHLGGDIYVLNDPFHNLGKHHYADLNRVNKHEGDHTAE